MEHENYIPGNMICDEVETFV